MLEHVGEISGVKGMAIVHAPIVGSGNGMFRKVTSRQSGRKWKKPDESGGESANEHDPG
jgi:hypothetical protein